MSSPALQTRTEQRQHQTLTPRLQHAVRLLQLSSLDFAQEVMDAMGKNPFLEIEDPSGEGAANANANLKADIVNKFAGELGVSGGIDRQGTVTIPNGAMALPLWREDW